MPARRRRLSCERIQVEPELPAGCSPGPVTWPGAFFFTGIGKPEFNLPVGGALVEPQAVTRLQITVTRICQCL